MTDAQEKVKKQIEIGKTKKLLEAGFPKHEIAKFMNKPVTTIKEYEKLINTAKEIKENSK